MPKKEPVTHADRLYNKRYEKEVQLYWIDELKDNIDKLDDWETNFVYSIETQLQQNKTLTEIKTLGR